MVSFDGFIIKTEPVKVNQNKPVWRNGAKKVTKKVSEKIKLGLA